MTTKTKPMRINRAYRKWFPNNCPVIERTADGVVLGTCKFYMEDGKTCPRHGNIRKLTTKTERPVITLRRSKV